MTSSSSINRELHDVEIYMLIFFGIVIGAGFLYNIWAYWIDDQDRLSNNWCPAPTQNSENTSNSDANVNDTQAEATVTSPDLQN